MYLGRSRLVPLLDALIKRIQQGSSLKAGLFELGQAPAQIRSGRADAVTGEGSAGAPVEDEVRKLLLEGRDPDLIDEEVYLMHQATAAQAPGGRQRFGVRVWLETYTPDQLDQVRSVTYRLHPTFPTRIIATRDRSHEFELWINVWGEFTITAYIERRDAGPLWLSRYLDLPGRPPD